MASTPNSFVSMGVPTVATSPAPGGMKTANMPGVEHQQITPTMGMTTVNQQMVGIAQPAVGIRQAMAVPVQSSALLPTAVAMESKVLDKRRLQELVKEVDPLEQLDDEVEEVLLQIADDFIESVVSSSCQIAKHRKSNTLEVKDVQLHLERNWNMWIPGFGAEELRPYKKASTTEAHKQRMALIRKTLKKC